MLAGVSSRFLESILAFLISAAPVRSSRASSPANISVYHHLESLRYTSTWPHRRAHVRAHRQRDKVKKLAVPVRRVQRRICPSLSGVAERTSAWSACEGASLSSQRCLFYRPLRLRPTPTARLAVFRSPVAGARTPSPSPERPGQSSASRTSSGMFVSFAIVLVAPPDVTARHLPLAIYPLLPA